MDNKFTTYAIIIINYYQTNYGVANNEYLFANNLKT